MGSLHTYSSLLALPTELLDNVLSFLDPYDLSAIGQTCKLASSAVRPANQIIWRYAFLKLFDDPVQARDEMLPTHRTSKFPDEAKFDWYSRLRDRCVALKTVTTDDDEYRRSHLHQCTDVLVDIIETARHTEQSEIHSLGSNKDPGKKYSKSIRTLEQAFQSAQGAEKVIHTFERDMSYQSSLASYTFLSRVFDTDRRFTRSMVPPQEPISDNASRLHVYYGLTQHERHSPRSQAAARRIVYSYEEVDDSNDYGPFKRDGTGQIDWPVFEAVVSCMALAFELLVAEQIKVPRGLRYALPYQVDTDSSCPKDWAGVTRRWLGTYSFVDYTMLHQLNAALRRGYQPSLDQIDEAHGDIIALELKLNDDLKGDPRLKTNMPICDDLPMLYFSGGSHPLIYTHATISVRGTVSLVPGGRQVRWRFIIRYGGVDQWQLEGVQPGGIRSGGVFGRWTHCDHDDDGPIGPFCYYPEDLCEFAGH